LPEATFIKGYYRIYAKYLNVDASAIIQRFDEIYANDTGLLPNHALKIHRLKSWANCLVQTVIVIKNG
jgi:cytoskeletal protein RodZ